MFCANGRSFSRLLRIRVVSVCRSDQRRRIFHEVGRFGIIELERTFVDRSVEAGTKHFFLDSSFIKDGFTYDREESNSHVTILSHVVSFQRKQKQSLEEIRTNLSLQLEQLSESLSAASNIEHKICLSIPSNFLLEELQTSFLLSKTRLQSPKLKIGYHLPTTSLSALAPPQMEQIISSLVQSKVDFVCLAVNPFTYKSAIPISNHLHHKHLPMYAVDVLRCHSTIPGQVNSSYDYVAPHVPLTMTQQGTNDATTSSNPKLLSDSDKEGLSEEERKCIQDLHLAFDRAIVMERALLSKNPSRVQEMVVACIGHTLSRRHFHFLEEFNYLVETQVKPQFEAFAKANDDDGDIRNWITLQRPIVNYLLSSYRSYLATRQSILSRNIAKIISSKLGKSANEDEQQSLELMPYRLAALAKHAIGAEDVGLSMITVDLTREVELSSLTKERIEAVYEEMGALYRDYCGAEQQK